jgi:hypothetical protein
MKPLYWFSNFQDDPLKSYVFLSSRLQRGYNVVERAEFQRQE